MTIIKSIYILSGLPGAGKTTQANQMILENNNTHFILLDDLSIIMKNDNIHISELSSFIQKYVNDNIKSQKKIIDNYSLIITDVVTCIPSHQLILRAILNSTYPNVLQNWIFFNLNKEQSIINSNMRNENNNSYKNVLPTIQLMSKLYVIDPTLTTSYTIISSIDTYQSNQKQKIIHKLM